MANLPADERRNGKLVFNLKRKWVYFGRDKDLGSHDVPRDMQQVTPTFSNN